MLHYIDIDTFIIRRPQKVADWNCHINEPIPQRNGPASSLLMRLLARA